MHFYQLGSYGSMIRDRIRTDAYARALRQCVTPSSVVLDMGTGVGIWALLACQFGARKVYAVDPNDVIDVARQIAAVNGYADRIEFIQAMSTEVKLPEKADVIVAEMHGVLPLFEQNIASMIDARRRLLVPGGKMIPEKETMWAAVVETAESYKHISIPWIENPYALNMTAGMQVVTNRWSKPKERIKPGQLLVEPARWATLDYLTLQSPNVSGELSWTVEREGTGHGFILWFDSFLADGISVSNAPSAPKMIFGNAFFPWSEPVPVQQGDHISISLRAELISGDYEWYWDTSVVDRFTNQIKARFSQSTSVARSYSSKPMNPAGCDDFRSLNDDGEIDEFILSLMNGEASLAEIARRVSDQFPRKFTTWEDALTRTADLSEKYNVGLS